LPSIINDKYETYFRNKNIKKKLGLQTELKVTNQSNNLNRFCRVNVFINLFFNLSLERKYLPGQYKYPVQNHNKNYSIICGETI